MTIAVAEAMLELQQEGHGSRKKLIAAMKKYGKRFPYAGYGSMFRRWLQWDEPQPYGSFGNGSAMRVSSVAWLCEELHSVRAAARLSAEVSHNHPEGIKGAEATASAIFLARTGSTKAEIKAYIEENFGYDLSRTCDEIRPNYHHVESCQETVPEAITAFLEGESFEDVIRTAVSLGGDCDTLTCIAGSIAEGFYGVPEELKRECRNRLPNELKAVLVRFDQYLAGRGINKQQGHGNP
jgi:ADP-ribosylglycohydrolase